MTVRHLRVFVTVCECGGITKAAEVMHVAQPAVSQTIADIEKYYGVVLFDRINHKLVLTDGGKNLLLKAKEVLDNFDDFENLASSVVDNPLIRIGVSLTFGSTLLPEIMKNIKQNYKNVKLNVVINNSMEIQQMIMDGSLDFAIIEGSISFPSIKAERFTSDKLKVVCGTKGDYPKEVNLKELVVYDLLLREKGSTSRDFLDNILSINGLEVKPVMESISNQAIISAVRENLGVAVLPEGLIHRQLSSGRLQEIKVKDAELLRQSYIISHKNKRFDKVSKEIYEHCLTLGKS